MTRNDEDILLVYTLQFSARQDAYVRDSRAHINEPLTPSLVETAFREGFSLSGYMSVKPGVGESDMTHVGAIDFDMDDGLDLARETRTFLAAHQVGSLLVGSRRGAHLWVTCDPVKGSLMRRALKGAIGLLGLDPEKAEVFPKQTGSQWGVGALRMPLMRHPKSGVRYPAYGPRDEVIERIGDCLMAFPQTSVDDLRALAGPGDSLTPIAASTALYRLPRASKGDEPRASTLLASIGLTASPGRTVKCPFHDDRHASLSVAADDMRVWCKQGLCPLYNDGRGVGTLVLEALIRKEPSRRDLLPPDPHGIPPLVR